MTETHTPYRYFALNKPINMLSQFVGHKTGNMLGKIKFDFPAGTNAVGRLDNLSEGLLLLTTDKRMTRLLFKSKVPHKRTYIVQVGAKITEADVEALRQGVSILLRGNVWWTTSPCEVELIDKPDDCYNIISTLHPRHPHRWLKMTLTEGKFRQIRKMMIAINNKCLRLVRISIEDLDLGDLPAGAVREYNQDEFFSLLKIANPVD